MITIDGKTYRTLPEQVEENAKDIAKIETDNLNIQGAMSELRNTVNYTAQRVIEAEERVGELNARVDSVEDAVAENTTDIEGLKTADTNIQGSISELRNTVNGSAQYLIETMNDVAELKTDVTALESRVDVAENKIDQLENTKLYRHNILLFYRHVNPDLTQVGSDGNFQIGFSLINNDPDSYSFKHNVPGTTAAVMNLECAWQSLRLYRALPQNSRDENVNYMPSSGFGIICEGSSAPLTVSPCMVNYLLATYYNANGNWERIFEIHSSKVDGSSFNSTVIKIKCGHPTFDADGNETSLWATKEEFEAGEYNTYSSYFCQNRIHCVDTVEEISLSPTVI